MTYINWICLGRIRRGNPRFVVEPGAPDFPEGDLCYGLYDGWGFVSHPQFFSAGLQPQSDRDGAVHYYHPYCGGEEALEFAGDWVGWRFILNIANFSSTVFSVRESLSRSQGPAGKPDPDFSYSPRSASAGSGCAASKTVNRSRASISMFSSDTTPSLFLMRCSERPRCSARKR